MVDAILNLAQRPGYSDVTDNNITRLFPISVFE